MLLRYAGNATGCVQYKYFIETEIKLTKITTHLLNNVILPEDDVFFGSFDFVPS